MVMVQKIYQMLSIKCHKQFFYNIKSKKQKQKKSQIFQKMFEKDNDKSGSFLACLIFLNLFWKNISLHDYDQSTHFFLISIGIFNLLGKKE